MDLRGTAPDEILRLPPDRVASYVARKVADKELSVIVRDLNAQVLDGTGEARALARAALQRLGFTTD